ncbi:unnamed protein product [Notodromas monacha]|uniref:Uncharacterized protein n=1 Tax=Notodromas monacha TaxID=399045 RepID=A0A7R9BT36_9CRUS|nr:unnamed protein product [Notodromas monacha]CAG0921248.1 unnamed protein product [Notodromas monacha]
MQMIIVLRTQRRHFHATDYRRVSAAGNIGEPTLVSCDCRIGNDEEFFCKERLRKKFISVPFDESLRRAVRNWRANPLAKDPEDEKENMRERRMRTWFGITGINRHRVGEN